jgi:hypothetical protein
MAVQQGQGEQVVRFQVRLPKNLNDRVEAMGQARRRSKNSELILALEERCDSFESAPTGAVS